MPGLFAQGLACASFFTPVFGDSVCFGSPGFGRRFSSYEAARYQELQRRLHFWLLVELLVELQEAEDDAEAQSIQTTLEMIQRHREEWRPRASFWVCRFLEHLRLCATINRFEPFPSQFKSQIVLSQVSGGCRPWGQAVPWLHKPAPLVCAWSKMLSQQLTCVPDRPHLASLSEEACSQSSDPSLLGRRWTCSFIACSRTHPGRVIRGSSGPP